MEIKIMKEVKSDYVVRLYDAYVTNSSYYLIQEFCESGDVKNVI